MNRKTIKEAAKKITDIILPLDYPERNRQSATEYAEGVIIEMQIQTPNIGKEPPPCDISHCHICGHIGRRPATKHYLDPTGRYMATLKCTECHQAFDMEIAVIGKGAK